MTEPTLEDTQADQQLDELLERSAQEQRRAAGVLREVAKRLDKLSDDMRRHGAFPLADQIAREKNDVERARATIAH